MALHVQRQLSKNVVQHPTLGHHRPAWPMEQLPGALLKLPGTQPGAAAVAVPSSPVSALPNRPTTDTFHQRPGSLAPFPLPP